MENKPLLNLLGLCWVSRHLTVGQNLVTAALSQQGSHAPQLVLVSSDASERTKKQLTNKCAFYQIPFALLSVSSSEVAAALGKEAPIAVLAVTDRGLANQVQTKLTSTNHQ